MLNKIKNLVNNSFAGRWIIGYLCFFLFFSTSLPAQEKNFQSNILSVEQQRRRDFINLLRSAGANEAAIHKALETCSDEQMETILKHPERAKELIKKRGIIIILSLILLGFAIYGIICACSGDD